MEGFLQNNGLSTHLAKLSPKLYTQAKSFVHCRYYNNSTNSQILRGQYRYWFIERVMPEAHLDFEAPLDAHIEIHTHKLITAILSDVISVADLRCEV
jgi:hypothetical protein